MSIFSEGRFQGEGHEAGRIDSAYCLEALRIWAKDPLNIENLRQRASFLAEEDVPILEEAIVQLQSEGELDETQMGALYMTGIEVTLQIQHFKRPFVVVHFHE